MAFGRTGDEADHSFGPRIEGAQSGDRGISGGRVRRRRSPNSGRNHGGAPRACSPILGGQTGAFEHRIAWAASQSDGHGCSARAPTWRPNVRLRTKQFPGRHLPCSAAALVGYAQTSISLHAKMSKAAAPLLNEHLSTAPGLGGDGSIDPNEHPHGRWLAAVKALRLRRRARDADWDLVYPWKYGELSTNHWTPISVGRRAAALLSRGPSTRVLDVGSGVGKFCAVAALTTPGIFCGVERCGEMVDIARAAAQRAQLTSTRFIHAQVEDVDWLNFDGFYFYNAFAELRWAAVDVDPEGEPEYDRLIRFTQETLDGARSGTRVVTYHGFGGQMPRSFRLVFKESMGSDFLELWVK